jgi:serine/threonine protein kinase
MDIIHRDIKPENILILNTPDPLTGLPIAKLLDFGLSKHAGLGSAAKTFVGKRREASVQEVSPCDSISSVS